MPTCVFTDSTETNELSHEVEYWDSNPVAGIAVPTAVSGLAVWLKADAGVQTNASGAVTNWVDQTGNGRNAWQTNADARPQLASGGVGGRPVIRFDGNDDGLNMGSLAPAFPTSATVFVVATLNADGDYNLLTTFSNSGYWRYSGNGLSYNGVFRATRVEALCAAPSVGSHIFAVESSGAKWEMWIDGDSRGSAPTAYYAGEDYRIGRPDGGTTDGRNLKGDIAEILIYDRPLSSLEHRKVGACLARKYGLTDMYRSGVSFAWVRIPALASSNTTVWAYWGKSGVTAPAYRTNGAVWSSSYLGVWHMDQTNDTDSSPKQYHGTARGTVLQMGGMIGKANDFDRSGDYVSVPDRSDFTLSGDYSVSAWVNPDLIGISQMVVGTYSNAGFMFGLDDTVDSKLQFWEGGWRYSSTKVAPGTWSHIVYTRSGTDGRFYINGSNVSVRTDAQPTGNGGGLELGGPGVSWGGSRFDGKVDQVELAAVKRSQPWIRAAWKNQAYPSAFVSAGTVKNGGAPIIINRTATNVTATTARLTASLVSTGLASTTVRVYIGTADKGTSVSGWWKTNVFPANTVPGLIGTNVSGFVSDTLYFYRFYATNTWGHWWGDPASVFITGQVGVTVPDPSAAEQGTDPMTFSVFRPSWATNAPLVVHYTVGGSAVSGADYPVPAGAVTIQTGSTNATVTITPYHDQLTGESSETVTLTLTPGAYRLGSSVSVTGTIANAGTKGWFVSTTGTDTNTGASWSAAYRTISNALVRAQQTTGDEVFVGAGTYNTAVLMSITNGVRVQGVDGPSATILNWTSSGTRMLSVTHSNAIVEGLRIRGATHGAVYLLNGTFRNCWIAGNSAGQVKGCGILMEGGTLANCVVSNNLQTDTTWAPGGGIYLQAGTVTHCKFVDNTIQGGGWGGYGVGAGAGVMMRGGILKNCLIAGNKATYTADANGDGAGVYQTGGDIINCTIADNQCASSRTGAGMYRTGGTVLNTIVFGNRQGTADQNITGTNGITYSCSPDLAAGVNNNITDNPLFTDVALDDFHLVGTSLAIDRGQNVWSEGDVDLDGELRVVDGNDDTIPAVDIGCYEAPPADEQPLCCSFTAVPETGFNSVKAVLTASAGGGDPVVTWYGWDFDNDGNYNEQGPGLSIVTNTYGKGLWTTRLVVSNASLERATYTRTPAVRVYPTVYYVAQSGSNTAPYETLQKAATNIQTVVDFAYAPGTTAITIRVAAGTWTLPARLDITKPLAVRSISGPAATVLRKPTANRVVFVTHAGAVLDGFTVQDSPAGGVELQSGVVTNCYIIRNYGGVYGAGVQMSGGVLIDCVVSSNESNNGNWSPGGGLYVQGGVVSRCRITENIASGGFWQTMGAGGGAYLYSGVLENCLVARNRATSDTQGDGGGVYIQLGRVVNCTVVSNVCAASRAGGGIYNYFGGVYGTYGGHVTNSIIAGNKRGTQEQNLGGTNRYYYCDSPDLVAVVNSNLVADPVFAGVSTGNYHLLPTSPCIDRGKDLNGLTTDMDRNARPVDGEGDHVAVTDMGCYEAPDAATLPLSCSFSTVPAIGLVAADVVLTAQLAGNTNGVSYRWDLDNNGSYDVSGTTCRILTNHYGIGTHGIRLLASNTVAETATYTDAAAVKVYPGTYFVSPSGGNVSPYDTWERAARDIQTVVDYAYAPGTTAVWIRVAAGTYNRTSRLNVGKALRVVGVDGAESTTLRWPGSTDRILYVAETKAVVSGFTIRDGTRGGVNLEQGTVTNCRVMNNTGNVYGGGVYMTGGTLVDCVVASNSSYGANWSPGGGMYVQGGMVRRCRITDNTAADGYWQSNGAGGGAYMYGGILEGCLVAGNKATSASQGDGGGLYIQVGRVVNCTIVGNTCAAARWGGGIFNYSGGIYGTYGGHITNSIIVGNKRGTGNQNLYGTNRYFYCNSPELVSGVNGNLTNDPAFKAVTNRDYHLTLESPCVNAGQNQAWMSTAVDLDREPRVSRGVVDMGAYEYFKPRGTIVVIR